MTDKTFTLDEAQSLLPVLESLLKQAMEAKADIEAIERSLQSLSHKIFLSGGLLVEVPRVLLKKAERERAVQRIKDLVNEIHATGVQVKDLDIGLLDFPCIVDGEIVLLCWKLGEGPTIGHWHGVEEGFAGRKPIATLKLETRKEEDPDKPN